MQNNSEFKKHQLQKSLHSGNYLRKLQIFPILGKITVYFMQNKQQQKKNAHFKTESQEITNFTDFQ